MIILYEENEQQFTTNGLGILSEATTCTVEETLNDTYELTMTYPREGKLFSKLRINRIIYCKPNPYFRAQPFRIYSISKPINGTVTINASHISYDMNGLVVGPINGKTCRDTIEKVQNGCIIDNPFKFYTDIDSSKSYKTTAYYNMRSICMNDSDSLLETYECEYEFDKFNVYLLKRRGSDRGAQIRYGKNMSDLTHEISYDNLYNGVYPYYHSESSSTTTTTTSGEFKQVYIVGTKPFQDGWLSYTDGGEAYHPVAETPVQITTEGDYYQKVYSWNSNSQRYVEKIYNESVTLIEGVTSPNWIKIDWSSFPTVKCVANVKGYFKKMTDTSWTELKKGETIFDGNILNISSTVAENMIIYYAEVIPDDSDTTEETETSVTHVELDDKIIWLDTPEAKSMLHNRILMLDLTSEFDETPEKDKLETKAKKYIEKNKIGKFKYNTTVSYVDLRRTTEGKQYKNFEKIELGDTVTVVYEDMDINIELRVKTTNYNVIKDIYDSIELGEKEDTISSNSVQTGDNVSSLTNDADYADTTTVNKLIAKTVTADYISAKNASLTKAQIEELSTARISCTGIIEASQFELDTLVAKMLTADNAKIKETLEAGTVKVAGNITVNGGQITINDDETGTVFNVDKTGAVTANSVTITGGSLNINDLFTVDDEGYMQALNAEIVGSITADSGAIGGFTIANNSIYKNIESLNSEETSGVYIGTDGIRLGASGTFTVTSDGKMKAKSAELESATLTKADISGKITATEGNIAGFEVSADGFKNDTYLIKIGPEEITYGTYTNKYLKTQNVLTLTKDGLFTLKGYNTDTKKESSIELQNGTITVTGNISSTSGNIGGYTIADYGLYNADIQDWNTAYEDGTKGVYICTDGIRVGAKLKFLNDGTIKSEGDSTSVYTNISATGKLTAKDADISGKITMKSGDMAGLTITSDSIYYGTETETSSVFGEALYIGRDSIRLGNDLSYEYQNCNLLQQADGADMKTAYELTVSASGAEHKEVLDPTYFTNATFNGTATFTFEECPYATYVDVVYYEPANDEYVSLLPDGVVLIKSADTIGQLYGVSSFVVDFGKANIYCREENYDFSKLNFWIITRSYYSDKSEYVIHHSWLKYQQIAGIVMTSDGTLYANNVDVTGTVHATDGEFTGKITSTSGSIGGITIDNSGLYAKNTAGTASWTLDKTGGLFISANGNTLTANSSGITCTSGTFTNATVTGTVTATGGKIGSFNIYNNGLYVSNVTKPAYKQMALNPNGAAMLDHILFNANGTMSTSAFPGYMVSTGTLSYTTSLNDAVTSHDYLFPWGVVTAYRMAVGGVSYQSCMPFDSVISLSPAMRNVSFTRPYYNESTSKSGTISTRKRNGPHIGMYIWLETGTISEDSYKNKTAAAMGFESTNPFLFAIVSGNNLCNPSGTTHMNNLTTCVCLTSTNNYELRVYNDSGSAVDGFTCIVFGIIDSAKSGNSLYYNGTPMSSYVGAGTHEYPFTLDVPYTV